MSTGRSHSERRTRARIFVGTLLAIGLAAASQGRSQAAPTSCTAGVVAQPTFSASDKDDFRASGLTATHTIQLATDFGSTLVDDGTVSFSLPADATVIPAHGDVTVGPDGLLFFSDTPGPVPLTVTWTQDDGNGGTCAGSASTTLQLRAATPMPRLKNELAIEHLHPNLKFDLLWRFGTDLGPTADLDPVTISARGVSRPRLPAANLPFNTVTIPLRVGDPGHSPAGQRHILLPRWTITTGGDSSAFYVLGDARNLPMSNVTLGYEVKVFQSGRLLAHLRLAGRCSSFACNMQVVKVQLT
jgi:hypothetical protein